jgi:hypothetical protein
MQDLSKASMPLIKAIRLGIISDIQKEIILEIMGCFISRNHCGKTYMDSIYVSLDKFNSK